jgi:YYY domain-containing protein
VHFGEIDITEFPYWSFLFGDLHPHLMGLPFFGLVIGLATGYVATAVAGMRGRGWVLAVALGAALGLERTVHTWDFPTALLIGGGGVVAGQALAPGRWQSRWWSAVGHLAVIAVVMQVAFAPYLRHFETFDPGLMRARHTTMAHQYFVQFGLFVTIALAFLAVRSHEEIAARPNSRNPVLAIVRGRIEVGALAVFVTGLSVFTWRFGLTVVALSVLIELFLLNLLWCELRAAERDIARLLATSMYALAFAVAAGVDVVTVQPDIERMNTVFKFGLQAWQLFALASAYAAWYVGRSLWQADGWEARPLPGRRAAAWGAAAVFGLLFLGSAIYLWSGTRARQEARFAALPPSFDGLGYLQSAVYVENHGTYDNPSDDVPIRLGDDEPLIRWLRTNVKGSPIVAEAVGPLYSWTARIANNTGLPAVVGWDWHQMQQRTDYDVLVQRRRGDTQQFFSDPRVDVAVDYLRRYNVSYVVVGTEERVYGTEAGLAKFARMPGLTEVFRSGPNAIYQVDQSHLGGQ